jgi:hypothetical protein
MVLAAGTSWQASASAGPQQSTRSQPHAPASVRLVVPADTDVTTTVLTKDAGDQLGYGLRKPAHVVVCTDCAAGDSKDLGSFPDQQVLVFYLTDATHGTTYSSNNRDHARLVRTTKYTWLIDWDDAGGDRDFNDLVTYIKLTPS